MVEPLWYQAGIKTQKNHFRRQGRDERGREMFWCRTPHDDAIANERARRIVACWNACRGISTEELESRAAQSEELKHG